MKGNERFEHVTVAGFLDPEAKFERCAPVEKHHLMQHAKGFGDKGAICFVF